MGDRIEQIYPAPRRRLPIWLLEFLSRRKQIGKSMSESNPRSVEESAPLPVTQQLQDVSEPEKKQDDATLDGLIDDCINLLDEDKNICVWLDDGTFFVGAKDHKVIFFLKEGDMFGRADLHGYAFSIANASLSVYRRFVLESNGKFCRSEYDEMIDAGKLAQLKQLCVEKEAKYHDVEQARLAFERQQELNDASRKIRLYLGK
jgi:hypothetical protein